MVLKDLDLDLDLRPHPGDRHELRDAARALGTVEDLADNSASTDLWLIHDEAICEVIMICPDDFWGPARAPLDLARLLSTLLL